jgi:hypothetical protein
MQGGSQAQQPEVQIEKPADDDEDEDLADQFQKKLKELSGSLHRISKKTCSLNNELGIADNNSAEFAARCGPAETVANTRTAGESSGLSLVIPAHAEYCTSALDTNITQSAHTQLFFLQLCATR